MKRNLCLRAVFCLVASPLCVVAAAPPKDYPITAVPFSNVKVADDFWLPRLEINRKVTVLHCFDQCEKTGRLSNFAKAARLMPGKFEGIFFNDSDVYKVIEGAAYTLASHPDPQLDKYLDDLITTITAAQQPDGYLNTYYTLVEPQNRWTNLRVRHELYCSGHLFEAAVAHHHATGKRNLLNVAIKLADHIDSIFGPDKRHDVPGHQEIEIGLVKLYRTTGDERYLRLAKFFLDERGHARGRELYGRYHQDHQPVVEQQEPVGHAVRAGYMYTAMADVAALTGEQAYVQALDRIWQDVVSTRQYITGGVGASRSGEAFGNPYEMPNATAYNETCAAIANALWNHRMFLLKGDGRYVDVLERIIYNGFLSGVSISGDRFFYPNPLAADGVTGFNQGALERSPWFGCACCPVNVVRFIPSIPGYVYAFRGDAVYVNLFVGGTATIRRSDNTLALTQRTRYPWDGHIEIAVEPKEAADLSIYVRIPGWAAGSPMPSDLYRHIGEAEGRVALKVNDQAVALDVQKGYARIARRWQKGDRIVLDLPMPVRRVVAHEKVQADAGRVALERGPIVYCVEAVDNGGRVRHLALPDDAPLVAEHRDNLLGGVTVLRGKALAKRRAEDGSLKTEPADFLAVPYYAWNHRGVGEMAVWLPRDASLAEPPPIPTVASTSRPSASHVWDADTATALNDQREPKNSGDDSIPRLTWWDHRGTTEWVQYDFKKPVSAATVEVYWFDDTGRGQCRVPQSWRILYKDGDQWKPVSGASARGVDKDKFNRVEFNAVQTPALRLEVQLQKNFSAGILEWKVQ